MFKNHEIDMLNGSLWDKIILFAMPLALTGVMQQLFNAADVAVLGQFVGKNAMAAVGNNTALIGLLVNLFMGLSLGANVVIAQNIGAKKIARAHAAVQTAFFLALTTGAVIAAIGETLVNPVFEILDVPEEVLPMAESYLRIYLLGLPVMGIYNFEAAIFRSRGDTQTPLISLTIASAINIALNLLFVLKFDMGVAGVAWATVIANAVSALMLFHALLTSKGVIHLDFGEIKFYKKILKDIVRIGLPAGIQGMVFALSNLLIQSAINFLGPDAMAASAAAFTIEINVFCVINGFGQAATTFISQNYGAGDLPRCKKITQTAMGLSMFFMAVMVAVVGYFAETLLKFFSDDANLISLGVIRIYYVVFPEFINVVMEILSGAMRGYGFSMPPAVITLIFICGIRIAWVYTIFEQSATFATLMAVYPVSWLVTMVFLIFAYRFYVNNLRVPEFR